MIYTHEVCIYAWKKGTAEDAACTGDLVAPIANFQKEVMPYDPGMVFIEQRITWRSQIFIGVGVTASWVLELYKWPLLLHLELLGD